MKKLIFVHGAGGTGAVWHYQAERFADCDAVTLPGRPEGDAARQASTTTGNGCMSISPDREYGTSVLAGQSMGGGIALSYALAYPDETAALILIGSGARLRVNPAFLQTMSDNIDKPPFLVPGPRHDHVRRGRGDGAGERA